MPATVAEDATPSIPAPTGCLVGDSLVMTSRGLVRLRGLGDPAGGRWQNLDLEVATDEGPRAATKFYVNGAKPVVTVETNRGYRMQGTTLHRIKVLTLDGTWRWRRFSDVRAGDRVPMMIGGMVGEPNAVRLHRLPEGRRSPEDHVRVPGYMTGGLAELLGYFMGDGWLHAKGVHFRVSGGDVDVVDRLTGLGHRLFGIDAVCTAKTGSTEVAFPSVRIALWWEACGFAKHATEGKTGKGRGVHVPDAVLATNNRDVYAAFVRGLFEADAATGSGYPSFVTATESFSRDVQTILLALGLVTTRRVDGAGAEGAGPREMFVLRLLNAATTARFGEQVGCISARKRALCTAAGHLQTARHDQVPVTRRMINALSQENDSLRRAMLLSHSRTATVSRQTATQLLEHTADVELKHILDFFYDEVRSAELGDTQFTYDIAVPENVTYIANGFVSHNTIGSMMDCATSGCS